MQTEQAGANNTIPLSKSGSEKLFQSLGDSVTDRDLKRVAVLCDVNKLSTLSQWSSAPAFTSTPLEFE